MSAANIILTLVGGPTVLIEYDGLRLLKAELVAEFDAGILDHFCPFRNFFLDDRGELGRRVAGRLKAKFIEPLAHLRQRQGFDSFAV
jgi:hypothetical protein